MAWSSAAGGLYVFGGLSGGIVAAFHASPKNSKGDGLQPISDSLQPNSDGLQPNMLGRIALSFWELRLSE